MYRVPAALLLTSLMAACASAPPPAPPSISFDTKMSWILRLEDQRMLRDAPAPVVPAPVTTGKKRGLPPPPPPPPPDLVRLLADPEARVRRRAALAIGRVALPDAASTLISVLRSDSDPEVRQMAAFALGLTGDKSQPVIDALRQALSESSPLVTGRAAEALGVIGDTASAPDIGRLVAAQVAAVTSLPADELRYPLEPAVEAFRLGAYALARLKAYEPLASAIIGPDGQSRVQWWPAAYALQRIEDKRGLTALLGLAKSEGNYTRAFAAKGLGAIKDVSAVPVLVPLISGDNVATASAIEAIRALGRIGDRQASEPLIRVIRNTKLSPMVRAEAIAAAASAGVDTSQDFFVDMLSDPAPTVRAAALSAFGKADDDTFLAVLSGLDPDPHWSVRAELATVLATKNPERVVPRLTAMLSDQDQRVLPSVLTALTKLKAPNAAALLSQHLTKDDAIVRTYAANGLGELKPDGAVDALTAAYKKGESDSTYSARAAALAALAKYGAAAATPTLKAALADKDWAVRVRAAELLKTLDPSVETAQAIRPAPTGRPVSYDLPTLVTPSVSPHVFFETEKGTIEIELDVLDAPQTCANFVALVGRGYFEGVSFHRLVPNFVVQGGDPRGDGEGGPGYTIRDEPNEEPYLRGTVGMALDWQDTAGSQFFITFSPQPHLDGRYTVFGHVVSGMDVVDKLTQWDVMHRVRVWDGQAQ